MTVYLFSISLASDETQETESKLIQVIQNWLNLFGLAAKTIWNAKSFTMSVDATDAK